MDELTLELFTLAYFIGMAGLVVAVIALVKISDHKKQGHK